jgi:hypothetical protein
MRQKWAGKGVRVLLTQGAWAHPWPRRPGVRAPRNSFPSWFPPVISPRCIIFAYITPWSTQGLYIIFLSYFVLSCFYQELILALRAPWLPQMTTRRRHLQKITAKTFSRRKKLKVRPRRKIKVHARAP